MRISGSLIQIFSKNILIMAIWHLAVLLACIYMDIHVFTPDKLMYRPHKWEKNGLWYKTHLSINKWKDILPQHIGKGGFSKEHLTSVSPEYLDEFIMETCRAEWNHKMSCLCAAFPFLLNPFPLSFFLSLVPIVCNFPFIAIQRYNRIRLTTIKLRLEKRRKIKQEQEE